MYIKLTTILKSFGALERLPFGVSSLGICSNVTPVITIGSFSCREKPEAQSIPHVRVHVICALHMCTHIHVHVHWKPVHFIVNVHVPLSEHVLMSHSEPSSHQDSLEADKNEQCKSIMPVHTLVYMYMYIYAQVDTLCGY